MTEMIDDVENGRGIETSRIRDKTTIFRIWDLEIRALGFGSGSDRETQ